jgi:multiple sugar transport system permease protein
MAVRALELPTRRASGTRWSPEATWGTIFVIPYVVIFLTLVVWPVAYGVWLGSSPASFRTLFSDPIYLKTVWNTVSSLASGSISS